MPFSSRSALDREPNALSLQIEAWRRSGAPLLDLSAANPTEAGIPYADAAILAALADPRALVYEPVALGPLRARQAVCDEWERLGFSVDPRRVLLTASTSEAYALLFKLLCDPGDEVLVPAPSYPLFEHLARFESVKPVEYPLRFDGRWHLEVEEVRARMSRRTRALLLVSPNNPTGHFLRRPELSALEALGLPLIYDEVFASFALRAPVNAVRTGLEAREALVFVLSGLSKLAALPQMKLAWTTVGGPEPLLSEALGRLELLADAYLSPSAPVLVALPTLLSLRGVTERAIRARLLRNLALLEAAVKGSAVSLLPVEAGWYAVLRLPHIASDEQWASGLLQERGVLVQPGFFFDFGELPHVVVSLLTPESTFEEGARRLVEYVERRATGGP